MSLKIHKTHHFSLPFSFLLKKGNSWEYNIILEIVFLEACPLLNFLVDFPAQNFFREQVSFPELQVWCIFSDL